MKYYLVTYKGLWLGGKAIVKARDEADAIERVKEDSRTVGFEGVTVKEIKPRDFNGVLYNDNGNY